MRPLPDWSLTGRVESRSVRPDSLAASGDSLRYGLLGVRLQLEYDSRDDPALPERGGLYRAWGERARATGGSGPGSVIRSGAEIRHHTAVSGRLAVSLVLHGEEVRGGGGELPPAEWIRFGGAGSVRGHVERSLLADRAGWVRLEAGRHIGEGSRAFLLADGALWRPPSGTGREWAAAGGLGLQLGTGAGTVEAALAVPVREGLTAAVVHVRARTRF
jgi:hypothetical protein